MSTAGRYIGRPWRSRFLRAPKLALNIAELPGVVPLAEAATATLGLKTGADSFFFVEPAEPIPAGTRFGEVGSRRELLVHGRNGWEGAISARDLLPVIRNPHELIEDGRRAFVVPQRTEAFYVYPRPRDPSGGLAEYIKRAIDDGIHQTALVRANADPKWWFRQVRSLVRPAWVLPYNSAYDYVAWENPGRAVINGRFVGVEPREGIDAELLGAALNSTFVAATRLLEGVSTGSEGAYDVGPPAARAMRIPDPRLLAANAEPIREALDEMRRADRVSPAPTRTAVVEPIRQRLDMAIALALGMGRGEAATLLGRLYESYARWRLAVEDVEAAVRVNRRAAHRAGTTRGESPIQSAARRTWEQIAASVRLFPRDLLVAGDEVESVPGTRHVRFPDQTPIFDPGVVTMEDGKRVDLGTWERVMYLRMLVDLGYQPPFPVLRDPGRADLIVGAFERERVELRQDAQDRAKAFVAAKDLVEVIDAVERLWHRACRAAGAGAASP